MKIIRYVNGEQIEGGLSGYCIANDGVLRLLALSLGAWSGLDEVEGMECVERLEDLKGVAE